MGVENQNRRLFDLNLFRVADLLVPLLPLRACLLAVFLHCVLVLAREALPL